MRGERVLKAEAVVVAQFRSLAESLVRELGFEFSNKRKFIVYATSYTSDYQRLMVEMFVDVLDEPFEVRMSLLDGNQLQVGWGSNNLLTTHHSDNDDRQIKSLGLIYGIFQKEAEWRGVLSALDLSPLLNAEAEEKAEAEALANKLKVERLEAYEKAGIKVGTVISTQFGSCEVVRISRRCVQIGKNSFDKEAVGEALLKGRWQVK